MKAAKTAIMIAAALVMTGPVRASPSPSAVLGETGAARLGHAGHEENLVVHAQAGRELSSLGGFVRGIAQVALGGLPKGTLADSIGAAA